MTENSPHKIKSPRTHRISLPSRSSPERENDLLVAVHKPLRDKQKRNMSGGEF